MDFDRTVSITLHDLEDVRMRPHTIEVNGFQIRVAESVTVIALGDKHCLFRPIAALFRYQITYVIALIVCVGNTALLGCWSGFNPRWTIRDPDNLLYLVSPLFLALLILSHLYTKSKLPVAEGALARFANDHQRHVKKVKKTFAVVAGLTYIQIAVLLALGVWALVGSRNWDRWDWFYYVHVAILFVQGLLLIGYIIGLLFYAECAARCNINGYVTWVGLLEKNNPMILETVVQEHIVTQRGVEEIGSGVRPVALATMVVVGGIFIFGILRIFASVAKDVNPGAVTVLQCAYAALFYCFILYRIQGCNQKMEELRRNVLNLKTSVTAPEDVVLYLQYIRANPILFEALGIGFTRGLFFTGVAGVLGPGIAVAAKYLVEYYEKAP